MDAVKIKINLVLSGVIYFFSAIFGKYWFLFAFLLFLNVADYLTGWLKSRYLKTESSSRGFIGICKKLLIWVLICVAFGVAVILIELGKLLSVNLVFTQAIGWYSLAWFIINEIRSILENIIEMGRGDLVPVWLVRGLAIAQNKLNNKANEILNKIENKKTEEETEE